MFRQSPDVTHAWRQAAGSASTPGAPLSISTEPVMAAFIGRGLTHPIERLIIVAPVCGSNKTAASYFVAFWQQR
jgi:hypothetical protein